MTCTRIGPWVETQACICKTRLRGLRRSQSAQADFAGTGPYFNAGAPKAGAPKACLLRRAALALLALLAFAAAQPAEAAPPRRIDTWLVCGTFPNVTDTDFDRDAIGEANLQPAEGQVSEGKSWRFFDDRLYCRNLDDYNDLYTFFMPERKGGPAEPTDNRLAYVHTYVWSRAEQAAQLRVGANDGYRAWLNGRQVGEHRSRMRRAVRDEDSHPVTLAKGWNRLLLKVANAHGVWGFYAALTAADGQRLAGLEYSLTPPGGDLSVATAALPSGYDRQPYVWIEIYDAPLSVQTPSASPFRLTATGGTPPYRWAFAADRLPPPGLWLDGEEGELHGICGAKGRFPVSVQVTDATGSIARTELTLEVRDRVTRWLEEARIGGHMHGVRGYMPPHGDPEQHARQMAREGYGYAKQTTGWWIGWQDWPGKFDQARIDLGGKATVTARSGHQDVSAYAAAFRKHGVRFGTYVGLPDAMPYTFPDKDYTLWPRYLDFLHAHLRDMVLEYRPALFYLDGTATKGKNLLDGPRQPMSWDLDAIYSLVKTLDPDCVLMTNTHGDNASGDVDIISVEGNNTGPAYWDHWPEGASGRNPKYLPVATWRYPFAWKQWEGRRERPPRYRDEPDYLEWDEWCRVVVSLVAEGFIADLDHSVGFGREAMHEKIGDWLHPRLASLVGTDPGPLTEDSWGYNVVRGNTIYLHVLKNGRGKTGWALGKPLTVGSLPGRAAKVTSLPDGKPLRFTQRGGELSIAMEGVRVDPIDTILAIELLTESGRKN